MGEAGTGAVGYPHARTAPAGSASSSWLAGMACEQVSRVMAMVACPRRSLPTLGFVQARGTGVT
jgi:hypothetical protein